MGGLFLFNESFPHLRRKTAGRGSILGRLTLSLPGDILAAMNRMFAVSTSTTTASAVGGRRVN
ncbi:hypothetical protein CO655_33005 [Rhizobium sp. M1]|nr:hypothetical protein CO655_33005 [Rhizobium sp. M1]PDT33122.1 hypothetical protein CO671_26300 [Rhizobium sp. M10]